MSLSSVKAYARARMVALGYVEWTDGFNFENIPRTLFDNRFHVELIEATGISDNQNSQDIEVPFQVRIWKPRGRDIKALIDLAISSADTVIADLIKASNRLTQSGIKTVYFNTMNIEPLDPTNDNGVSVRLGFTALVVISSQ